MSNGRLISDKMARIAWTERSRNDSTPKDRKGWNYGQAERIKKERQIAGHLSSEISPKIVRN